MWVDRMKIEIPHRGMTERIDTFIESASTDFGGFILPFWKDEDTIFVWGQGMSSKELNTTITHESIHIWLFQEFDVDTSRAFDELCWLIDSIP